MTEFTNHQPLDFAALKELAAYYNPDSKPKENSLPLLSSLNLNGLTESLHKFREKSEAAELIILILENNPNITEIHLEQNIFSERDTLRITQAIEKNPHIDKIHFNHFNFRKLAYALPFLETMALRTTVKELHFENTIPTSEFAAIAKLNDNSLPEVALQFLAINYLFEETHQQPIHFSQETQTYIGMLQNLEMQSIEQRLSKPQSTSAQLIEFSNTTALEDTSPLEEKLSSSQYSTGEFIVHRADEEEEIEEFNVSYVTEEDTPQRQYNYEPPPKEASKKPENEIIITSLKELENLCNAMELLHEDILNQKDSERLLKIKKVDINGLYKKLGRDDQEEVIHLIVTIAENAPYVEKLYLPNNNFSPEDLKAILNAFDKATDDPKNKLKKMDFEQAIDRNHLDEVAPDLIRLQAKLGRHLYLDKSTRNELQKIDFVLQQESKEIVSTYQRACEDYREFLERKIILPAFKENKLLRDSYSTVDEVALMKKVMYDLTQQKPHPIKKLKNDPQIKMAIKKIILIQALENITQQNDMKPSIIKEKFEALYQQEKKELPQLLLKNDKSQYSAFLNKIGDINATKNIKDLGYVTKSQKPKKHFMDETQASPSTAKDNRPTSAQIPVSLFFREKRHEKNDKSQESKPTSNNKTKPR